MLRVRTHVYVCAYMYLYVRVCLFLCVCPFQLLNQLADFHETGNKCYTIGSLVS
jgi:hypothetical protein